MMKIEIIITLVMMMMMRTMTAAMATYRKSRILVVLHGTDT